MTDYVPALGSAPSLQDLTLPVSSRLWAGSKIYCTAATLTYGLKVNIGNKPSVLANPDIISVDTGSPTNMNFSRRKGYTQYAGINNPDITMSGNWTIDSGSTIGGYWILSPNRLMRMALSGHVFYLDDMKFARQLKMSDTSTYPGFYTGSGIPVVITDVSFNTNAQDLNRISYSISFIEDKEATDTR